jgi:asparagine synthase (glutamine-hydrolysing)
MAIPEDQFLRSGQRRWLSRRLLQEAGAPAIVAESTKRGAWCPEWFTHLNNRKPVLPAEIARLRASSLATRLIDIDRLANATANWPTDAGEAESRRLELDTMLTRALHVGAFIQWAEAKS